MSKSGTKPDGYASYSPFDLGFRPAISRDRQPGLGCWSCNLAVEFAGVGATSGLGFNDRFDASLSDRFHERFVITLGLISIVDGKVADRLVKNAARTHVARNHGGVARARVGSRPRPPARSRVSSQGVIVHGVNFRRNLHVAKLAHVEVGPSL